jgi:hypothetical protein
MDNIDKILLRFVPVGTGGATLIVCLFTGRALPLHCAPMSRRPAPPTGMPFDNSFPEVFAEATKQNPAVHDGAVMVRRRTASEHYHIVGWSFRLFPEANVTEAEVNRGSAFNSAQAMSRVATIDAVYCISGKDVYRFCDGVSVELTR